VRALPRGEAQADAWERPGAGLRLTIDPLFFAELLLMGTVTGFLAGMLGIGGGMIQVPFLTTMLAHHGVAE
jgi:hypothetical protein